MVPPVEQPAAPEPAPDPAKKGLFGRSGRGKDKPAKPEKSRTAKQAAAPQLPQEAATDGKAELPAGANSAAAKPKGRSSRPALIIIASVAAVVLLVSAAVWLLTLRSTAPSGAPTNAGPASALDPLLTASDLGTLGGVTWVNPSAPSDGIRPLCLPVSAEGLPEAQRSVSRRIGASTSDVDSLVQVVDTYPDAATATQAYAVRLAQAGTCPDTTAWITSAARINGLADSADAVRLTVQDESDQFHTLLLSRTGRTVSLIDLLTTTAAVPVNDIAQAAAKSLSRQCSGEPDGSCPGLIEVVNATPAADNLPGWLVEADLPRITPAAGRWAATEPATALSVVGSQCEAVDLQNIAGTTVRGQRTFLLADDGKAPNGFGVDQAVYTFSGTDGAKSLAKKLNKNLGGCPDRAPTATVEEGPAVKATGANGEAITGTTYRITQKTEANTLVFRVAVVTVGNRVCYLLANPGPDFDFSDDQWRRVAARAGQRVSQS